jgi:glycosyltransferase involved in cell wall biosynthesis
LQGYSTRNDLENNDENSAVRHDVDSPGHVVYLQFAGDFRESLERFARGESGTYFGQRYSVDEVLRLTKMSRQTTVVCCLSDQAYDSRGPEGIRMIGLGLSRFERSSSRQVIELCKRLQPTHVIVRFPHWRVISSLLRSNVRVLPTFADSIGRRGVRARLRKWLLSRVLNSNCIPVVGNHQVNACRSLERLGVDPGKIVPYDWPSDVPPGQLLPKRRPEDACWRLLYCGAVVEDKGVADILRGISILRSRQIAVTLQLLGSGNIDRFRQLATELGIGDTCEFRGRVGHDTVLEEMRAADIVLVPSHHAYSEGLPFTIREALGAHTPLIVSDHPMFAGVIIDHVNGLVVPEKSPPSIANGVVAYMIESGLYERVSRSCAATSASIEIPLKWGELVEKWLDGGHDAIKSLLLHSLANRRKQSVEPSRVFEADIGVKKHSSYAR